MTQALIRQTIEIWAKAFCAKDADAIMSVYADTIVSFDIGPPLRYTGHADKRRAWQDVFAEYSGPIVYELHELSVDVSGDLAFAHSVNHLSGTLANGKPNAFWLRWTACLHRIAGRWLIVHDHVSVPADLPHGKALTKLTPGMSLRG